MRKWYNIIIVTCQASSSPLNASILAIFRLLEVQPFRRKCYIVNSYKHNNIKTGNTLLYTHDGQWI